MDEPPPPPEEGGMSVCHEEAKPAVPSVSQGALPPTPPGTPLLGSSILVVGAESFPETPQKI